MKKIVFIVLALLSLEALAGYQEGNLAYEQNRFADAVKEYQPLADKGDVNSQYALGLIYAKGDGKDVPEDLEQAAYWFAKAANQGDMDAKIKLSLAQLLIGDAYYSGDGKPKDYAMAAKWLLPSAESGNIESQFMIGIMFEEGQHFQQDDSKAVYWYRKAAEQGHENSSVNLGTCYKEGHGVPKDFSQASYWFKKAAAKGYGDGYLALGNMYYNGEGVNQDYVIAYMFWKLADSHESESAKNNLEVLDKELTDKQIAEAESLASKWQEGKPFPTKSKTWQKPQPVKTSNNASSKLKVCAPPKGNNVSYSDDCTNGDCVRTFSNGCQKRFQAPYCYDALQSQWTWKPNGC